jgi:sugar/nucleoside kinase (ribokinase family)
MKLAVFSHCTIDSIQIRGTTSEVVGGAASYCGIAAKKLKFDVEIHTKFGNDFPKEILERNNLELVNSISDHKTTRFKIKISGSERTLSLLNQCDPIEYSDIDVDGIVISPVYHEISKMVYEKIKNNPSFILLDPQGFLRRVDAVQKIILEKTDIDLTKISAIKVSPDELFCLTNEIGINGMKNLQKRGVKHVIVTNKREINMLVQDKIYSILLPNLELRDTTGVGDIFCSTFCCTMLREKDFFWALCFAGGAAQAAIESKEVGLEKIPSKGSVETNAAYFYNQVKYKQV